MKIKLKVKALIGAFEAAVDKFNKAKAKLEADTVYSANIISAEIRKLEQDLRDTANEANATLQATLQSSIDEIRSKKAEGNNFELQLSNALGFLSMIGEKMKDEAAFSLVQPFFGDYQTMHKLSLALSNKSEIPATLFAVSGYDAAIKQLKAMQTAYKTVFSNHESGNKDLASGIMNTFLMTAVDDYEAFLDKLDKYLSASEYEAEKIVAAHMRSRFGFGDAEYGDSSAATSATSRSVREALAK